MVVERWEDGSDYLRWHGAFEFLISADGRVIKARALSDDAEVLLVTYLLSQALSFALIKHGLEPTHGTCVQTEGGATAFLGPSGSGKSTLAAAFLRDGHRLITDDLFVVDRAGGEPFVQPAMPRIKLYPRIAERLLPDLKDGVRISPRSTKRAFPLGDESFCRDPVALKAIYVLRRGRSDRITARRLSAKTAFRELLASSFNRAVTHDARLAMQLHSLVDLAATTPVKSLTYPHRLTHLPDVVKAIQRDAASVSGHRSPA